MNPGGWKAEHCVHCGGLWKILEVQYTEDRLLTCLAAHSCDGIGVMAQWARWEHGEGWTTSVVDTEHFVEVTKVGDEDPVPVHPPIRRKASAPDEVLIKPEDADVLQALLDALAVTPNDPAMTLLEHSIGPGYRRGWEAACEAIRRIKAAVDPSTETKG